MSCPTEVDIPRILEASPQLSKHGYPLNMTIVISRYKLILQLNELLINSDFDNKVVGDHGRTPKWKLRNCFYQGWIEPFSCAYRVFDNWNVTVSACHGLRGEFGNFPFGYVVVKPNGPSYSIHQNHTLSYVEYRSGNTRSWFTEEASERELSRGDKLRPKIEVKVYSDDSMYVKHGKVPVELIHYIANAVNKVDMLYDAVGIDVALNGLEIWTTINTKLNKSNIMPVLKEFNTILYRQGRHRFDVGVLFSAKKFTPIGLAFKGTCCTIVNGLVIGQSYESIDLAAIYLAHEIAHTLGLSHDDDKDSGKVGCHCGRSSLCIMNSVIQEGDPPKQWSNCSVKMFHAIMSESRYGCLYQELGKSVENFVSQLLLYTTVVTSSLQL